MRILRVRGENLASLAGPFEVDFEADPLGGAGLFAITGPTGAGKSTLLDAVCLALYDRLPRLASADGRAEVGHADDPDGTTRLKYDDVRGILRHGTGAGYAEVEFMGQDGRCYVARWEVRRAHNRPSGRLQAQTVTLRNVGSGERIGDRKTDTLGEIRQRIGLEFEQFRRAVLLAQGEFDSFIRADARQRSELLERLTGTQIYAALSKAAFQRAKAAREQIESLRNQLGANPPLSGEERARAETRLGAARAELDECTAQRDALTRAVDWFVTQERLHKDVTAAEAEHQRALQADTDAAAARGALDTARKAFGLRTEMEAAGTAAAQVAGLADELRDLEARCQESERELAAAVEVEAGAREHSAAARKAYDDIGPLLDMATALDATIEEAERNQRSNAATLEAARAEHVAAEADHEARTTRLDSAAHEARAHTDWLAAHKGVRVLAERVDVVTADVASAAALIGEIAGLESSAQACCAAATRAEEARQAAETNLEEEGRLISGLETRATPLRAALAAADRPALGRTRAALQDMQAATGTALDAAREVSRITGALAMNARGAEDARKKAAAGSETLAQVTTSLPVARARVEEARHALLRSEASVTEQAEHLRSLLVDGEPCPVCGATEHPFALAVAPLDQRLKADRARVSKLQAVVDDLITQQAQAAAEMGTARAELTRLGQEHAELSSHLSRLQGAWTNAVATIERAKPGAGAELPTPPADPTSDAAAHDLMALQGALSGRVRELDAEIEAYDGADSELREVEAQLRKKSATVQALREQVAASATREALNRAQETAARALLKEKTDARDSITGRLHTVLRAAIGDWADRLRRDPSELEESCRGLADEWVKRTEESAAAQRRVASLREDLREAEATLAAASARVQAADVELNEATGRLKRLRVERAGVIDGRPVGEVRTEYRVRAEGAAGHETQATAERARSAEALIASRTKEATSRTAYDGATAALQAAERTLAERLAASGLTRAVAAAALDRGEHWIENEQSRLDGLRAAVGTAAATLGERQRALAAHESAARPTSDRQTTEALRAASEEAQQVAVEEQAAALAAIMADDRARATAADVRARLEEKTASAEVWNALDDLIGSADGNKFRRFVQALTLERLLRRSNRHLADLAPRYQLECAPGGDLALQVIDRHMADEVRGVHNLSGGERFLVSLALALGLASMSTAQGIRVDTLFIDEGFGALDDTCLALAIGALEALQATGRKVGVISHLGELKERIGVKIQVTPRGGGRSEIEVVRT